MSWTARLRRFWLDVHLWLGVGLAILVVPLALSGSILVWHDDIERWLHPQRHAVSEGPRLAPSAFFSAGQAALGDRFAPVQVRMPAERGDPVAVNARAKGRSASSRPETRTVFLDPSTARVLDVANTRASFFGFMHVLHGSFFIPEVGRKIVGWLGWAMLASSLTGIWLWWPRNGDFFRALFWRRSPSTNFNLHHMIGFWIALPLAVLSLTGIYISFPQTARRATEIVLPMSAQPARTGGRAAPLAHTQTSADAAVAAALAFAPGASVETIAPPSRGREPVWRVGLKRPGEDLAVTVEVADATGQARPLREPLPGDGVPLLMRRVHDGVGFGVLWRSVIFVAGLAPAVLATTGTIMWLRRRARRRAVVRRAKFAAAA